MSITTHPDATTARAATLRPFDTVIVGGERFGISEDGVDGYAEVVSVEVTYLSATGPRIQRLTFLPDEQVQVVRSCY